VVWNGPVYDCQECGACCLSGGDSTGTDYVYLDKNEARRMKRLGLTVIQAEGRSFLGVRSHLGAGGQPACVAFHGVMGARCGCSIYLDRPTNCRNFEVGGPGCREARAEAGLPL